MTALLLIDIQNDFLPGGSLAVPGGYEIIPVVSALQGRFELVVATQDWHPPSHKSFASNHPGQPVFSQVELDGLPQVLWPDHCIQGTAGAALSQGLSWNCVEAIFRKGTDPAIDSYSGFYDNGHRKATGLAGYLRERGVTDICIAGLAADYCVYYTAKDALDAGFRATVVADATRAIDADGFRKAAADLRERGGLVMTSSEL
ncbi:MAG: nicotinamidase [Flaviaesturariibacter sp.]|nr:nicotinamidase [Flaviaesturariibacter sp.]